VLKSPTRCLKSSICSASPWTRATVEQAIIASGLLALRDDIDLAKNKLGIYSRPVKLHDEVHDGDRVEIYRPLIADPKELRRQRAEKSAAK
jgi:putative ubiquitin-RnfH superfamily antitoxin RatB of RatAB toxin-antitoxin module